LRVNQFPENIVSLVFSASTKLVAHSRADTFFIIGIKVKVKYIDLISPAPVRFILIIILL